MLFLPELTMLGAGLALFVMSLGRMRAEVIKDITAYMLLMVFITTIFSVGSSGMMFYGAFEVDALSQVMKTLVVLATLIIVLFSNANSGVPDKTVAEFYLFMLMSVLGLMMLVSATDLLGIFVSLELSSFTVYLMVAMRHNKTGKGRQSEAGIKYLLYGVAASGMMLFGMSYIFGLTGSIELAKIAPALAKILPQPIAVVAVLLVLAGFFYKVALFPMHFWVPDVYEGASNEATAFIATVPKLIGVMLLIKIVSLIGERGVLPVADKELLTKLLAACAIISMFYGNLAALLQKDLKRMLGFSGIAHAGFALLAVALFGLPNYAIAVYYMIGYLLMNLACFMVLCLISPDGKNVAVEDLAGLYKRAPMLAITLTCGLFALAGIPPFVGFMSKFMVLMAALHEGYTLFVVMGAVNTAIAIYYYLSAVRMAYCTDDEERAAIEVPFLVQILAVVLMVWIVLMGGFPDSLLGIIVSILA